MYLIDTNVISELTKSKPDSKVIHFLEKIENPKLSVITYSELSFGISRLEKSKQKLLLHWIDNLRLIAKWILVDEEISYYAGILRSNSAKNGVTLSLADGLIAATAEKNNLTLATRNIKDFEGTKISLINPF
jgi:predicted nucleic acid-binding protein